MVVGVEQEGEQRARERKRVIEGGVGSEVFRDSLWSDCDTGTRSHP